MFILQHYSLCVNEGEITDRDWCVILYYAVIGHPAIRICFRKDIMREFSMTQKKPGIITKETSMLIDGSAYKVISHFEGKETASKLLYDMAVSRILNEPKSPANTSETTMVSANEE